MRMAIIFGALSLKDEFSMVPCERMELGWRSHLYISTNNHSHPYPRLLCRFQYSRGFAVPIFHLGPSSSDSNGDLSSGRATTRGVGVDDAPNDEVVAQGWEQEKEKMRVNLASEKTNYRVNR